MKQLIVFFLSADKNSFVIVTETESYFSLNAGNISIDSSNNNSTNDLKKKKSIIVEDCLSAPKFFPKLVVTTNIKSFEEYSDEFRAQLIKKFNREQLLFSSYETL